MTDGLEILPVRGIGHIVAGDDLVELIAAAAPWIADGDVLVVTSKIVSKAEGRLVEVPADGEARDDARREVLASETARVVARRGPTTIVQTHHGFVMAAAGIDASNVDKTHLVLLPADPDTSARQLRAGFRARGLDVGVIVSDTMGRAWRNGLTDVALGAAGIEPIRDHRGETDPYGNELEITQMAVIDELAAAGELVKGKCDQVPVAVVRGYPRSGIRDSSDGAAVLLRDAASDMFSLGTAEARALGLREAAQLPDNALPGLPIDPAALERAAAAVADALSPATTVTPAEAITGSGATAALHLTTRDMTPIGLMRLGADAHRLRAALAAESIVTLSLPHDDGIRLELSGH
ncbi:coenzyme F420-0:L-glutamate ligase [Actinoplanes bogorensis]|uniref:Coenzyme F420-0:L-glutamate ligase n=1 Tax=Paractinoplanes bogorensis TaxID=1610840 RepID=A0ABS5Z435_9ACTN|nr:coenzyme F420-0:L-glutamate ligase [Actinoplanes bogorensis]MBU2670423.1 coenzyme F420-0:L-glutamate ligase [Actinoplanes bogorensis]